jgi:outer membrane protein assembly factor BamA
LAPDYARRGGFYGVTFHDYADTDSEFGFERIEYEAIQHIPILRETWVLSLRGRVETTSLKEDQEIPYFMLPALGSGSTLRAFSSWRFRDRNSVLLQAEWRVMVNRLLDIALFYDAGKVTAQTSDLSFDGLKSDVGFGVRFHGPMSTPLRVEIAHGDEGFNIVFGASSSF